MKLFLWLLIGLFAFWCARTWRRTGAARAQPQPRPAQRMVPCACCGVNQPVSECVLHDGRYFCCAAHAGADCAGHHGEKR